MSTKTKSELKFEQFCNENSISYTQIDQSDYRTADYEVHFGEHRVVIEVKQINPNACEKKYQEQLPKLRLIGLREKSAQRVRHKIEKAREQLKNRSRGKFPAILVLYDNSPFKSIDSTDIKNAMYGNETVNLYISDDHDETFTEIKNGGFGSGRKFTKVDNTTISGIAMLYVFGNLRLEIYHNQYAKFPFEPSWLRRNTVTHFQLEPLLPGKIQEWIVV
jgi:hypothetical protein